MTEYFQAGLVDLEVSSLLPGLASSPYEWVTSVQLFNLTENLTVISSSARQDKFTVIIEQNDIRLVECQPVKKSL